MSVYPRSNVYPPAGITKLSELVIDVDKDWAGKKIKNLGAPVDAGDALRLAELASHRTASPIDHPDRSIPRGKLEYPTADVTLAYLSAIGKAVWTRGFTTAGTHGLCTVDSLSNVGAEALCRHHCVIVVRGSLNNDYHAAVDTLRGTSDFLLAKFVNGARTELAAEAVDLSDIYYRCKLTASGSTLKAYREDMATPRLTVTDTSLSSGVAGVGRGWDETWPMEHCLLDSYLRPPSSPSPRPAAYFEVTVVGSGTLEDPFRPAMPEEISWEWSLNPRARRRYDILKARGFADEEIVELFPEVLSCRVNRLALTHSAVIKTDRATGRPTEYRAIVRIFEQPDRQAHLRPTEKCLEALRAIPGARQLTREEAIREARRLDDLLTDYDLLALPRHEPRQVKEYVEWRLRQFNVEMKEEDALEYLRSDKGW